MSLIKEAFKRLEDAGYTIVRADLPAERPFAVLDLQGGVDGAVALPPAGPRVVFAGVNEVDASDLTYGVSTSEGFGFVRDEAFTQAFAEVESVFDLRTINPALRRFEKRDGEPGLVEFVVPYAGVLLTWMVAEPWYDEYLELRAAAESEADVRYYAAVEKVREAARARTQALESKLGVLLDEPDFLDLARLKKTTVKSVVTLVKAKHPEVSAALGDTRLKEIVSDLVERVRVLNL
ncbi:hypothetical protein [Deinococcus pimensis]|uniref:hypothetical protein n=1 Tax=Deinococcus pimensis TaxID=309888 RepID=UPI000487B36B|nr:hypothetical protein [Deinococcus pimensis]